ncbi:MAG TPA: response regulator transcription factor [Rugosimonospora sp.]|nr:response regulator transcription factor [Rugosimonospora sp.]
MIRLLIVSDATLVRVGLSAAVAGEHDMTLAGCAWSPGHAMALCTQTEVNVAVVESRPANEETLALAAQLRTTPSRPGVVLLGHGDDRQVLRAMSCGISAYLPLNATVEVVLATIRRAAAAPDSFTAPDLARALRLREADRQELSPREGEVLQRLREGTSLSTIAHQLLVSESTVKTYATRIYEKLGVRGRKQAVEVATRSGLFT